MLDWMIWMPVHANTDDMLVFAGTLWMIHQVFAVGCSFFFNFLHRKNYFPNRRFANGKAPPEKLFLTS